MPCPATVEDVFGPRVAVECLDGFDFTLLFEECILTLLPMAVAVVWSVLPIWSLYKAPVKVQSSRLYWCKMISYLVAWSLQLAILAIWSTNAQRTSTTLATLSVSLVGLTVLAWVSHLEHWRSRTPSTLLTLYFGLAVLLNLPRVRTMFYMQIGSTLPALNVTLYIICVAIFASELVEKRRIINPKWADESPQATVGVFNRSLFAWLNHLLRIGFSSPLTMKKLDPADPRIRLSTDVTKLQERWSKAQRHRKHALLWTFMVHYKVTLLVGIIPRIAYIGFSFMQPLLAQRILDYQEQQGAVDHRQIAYGLIAATAIVYTGNAISFAAFQHQTDRAITKFRGSLVRLTYDKVVTIHASKEAKASAVTLINADIDRLALTMRRMHSFYASSIEMALSLWLLSRNIGVATAAPALFLIVCILLCLPFSTGAGKAQGPWLEVIETRLAATSTWLGGLKGLRMIGFAKAAANRIGDLRKTEVIASRRHRVWTIWVDTIWLSMTAWVPIWGFGVFVILARARGTSSLTPGVAFSALSLFRLQNQPLLYLSLLPEDVRTITLVFSRFQDFLELDERTDPRKLLTPGALSETSIEVTNEKEPESRTSVEVTSEKGAQSTVWSAKSPDADFAFSITQATASYPDTEKPILRDLNLHIPKKSVTIVCGQVGSGKSSLLRFILGELNVVSGEISTTISSAGYCPQTPWIPYATIREVIIGRSPWDEKWYDQVVGACELRDDFNRMASKDQTMAGSSGARLSGGQQKRVAMARALYSRSQAFVWDEPFSGLDPKTEQKVIKNLFGPEGLFQRLSTTVVIATNTVHLMQHADLIVVLSNDGTIARQGPYTGTIPLSIPQSKQEVATQSAANVGVESYALQDVLDQEKEVATLGRSDLSIYPYFIKAAGQVAFSTYFLVCVITVFAINFPTVWVQWWANSNVDAPNNRVGYWVGVYVALGAITTIGCMVSEGIFWVRVIPNYAVALHERLLQATTNAKMSWISSIDKGRILNRFSQDLQLLDSDLPASLLRVTVMLLGAVMQAVLIFLASGYLAATLPACAIALWGIQAFYLRTSRQLRQLDIQSKAPLFSLFEESLDGVASIRGFGWVEEYTRLVVKAIDESQIPYYLLWCVQRWLALVIDLLLAGIATILVAIALTTGNGSKTSLGTAIVNIVVFGTTLQALVVEWTQLEMSVGAIRRIRKYILDTVPEGSDTDDSQAPETWPTNGSIELSHVYASHYPSRNTVLHDLTLSVHAGQRVAICGRTGSGKSSLLDVLLRLLDVDSGSVVIDGIDTNTLSSQLIRERIATIPQFAIFIQGNIRDNMDPDHLVDDEMLIDALRQVQLWDIVHAAGGLDGELREALFSHGQQKLLCLARAMLRSSKILILDEIASGIDRETSDLMHKIIRERFDDCTVLSISHDLHSVQDFDRVILLDQGRLVENGDPVAWFGKDD